jgi:hypothetical protein
MELEGGREKKKGGEGALIGPCDFLLLLDGRFETDLVACGPAEDSSVYFDDVL